MRRKIRNTLGGLILLLSGCSSLTPNIHGNVEASYVPRRIDDKSMENEIKTGFDVELDWYVGDTTLYFRNETDVFAGMSTLLSDGGFDPHRINPDYYIGIQFGDWDFYFRHSSQHPFTTERWIYENRTNNQYCVGDYDYIEEFGVKLKFGSAKKE